MRPNLVLPAALGLGLCSAAAVAQPVITLLDAGSAPRQELRYRFEEGYSETLALNMTIGMTMSMAGLEMPQNLPTVRMLMDIGATEVSDDGTARFEYVIRSADVVDDGSADPTIAAALGMGLGQLGDFSGWALIDTRGATRDAGINLPDGAPQQLSQVLDSAEQSMQQMSAPLPMEPVGVGARWEVDADVDSGGFSISQHAVYTLTGRDGDDITVDVMLEQSAAPQAIDAPGLPAGTSANLESLESTGSGNMQINLARLVPRSDMSMAMAMAMSMAMQGQTQQIATDMQTDMSIAPTTDAAQ